MREVLKQRLVGRLKSLRKPLDFTTAAGKTKCEFCMDISFPTLNKAKLVAHVLDDTPAVISIGKLCMEEGYAFHWPVASDMPYFETPDKSRVYCRVENCIPYIDSHDSILGEATCEEHDSACPVLNDSAEQIRWHHTMQNASHFIGITIEVFRSLGLCLAPSLALC